VIRLLRSIVVERDPADVFKFLAEPDGYPRFFAGITRWQACSEKSRGLGARYRVLMRVGPIQAGGTVRVTVWEAKRQIAWTAERGIAQSGAWKLNRANGKTDLTLEIEYELVGPASWLVERIAARTIARNMLATLLAVRRELETGPT
jgi:ribosome-associated toxin RatA of RatAB toxin-antitoxin module